MQGSNANYRPSASHDNPKPTKRGKAKPPVWERVAKVLLDAGVSSALEYINVVFDARGAGSPPPEPQHLLGAAALEAWRQRPDADELFLRLQAGWKRQHRICGVAGLRRQELQPAGRRETLLAVVADTRVELSPLYRYCVALGEQADELAARYKAAALAQYCKAPGLYKRVCGDWLPHAWQKREG